MAHFSNGTEGMVYEEMYCFRCIHCPDEENGCAVWDAHFLYNGDKEKQDLLDLLIPMKKDGLQADQCSMFKEK